MRKLRRSLFGISDAETTFARRGFHMGCPRVQQRLERVGEVFVLGYHAALDQVSPEDIVTRLETVELEFRGFAYEGAAMGVTLLDSIVPWRRNGFKSFLDGPGNHHTYMLYVGAGWALARLGLPIKRFLARHDPLLSWLAIDGYGFHEGYFNWRHYYENQALPKKLSGYARRVFDQGLGRCMWFVDCADVDRISSTISRFPLTRQADLWSGLGLACAYAGGVERADLEALKVSAAAYVPHLAQGAAFGARARERAGNPASHTELACDVLCGLSARQAARATELALQGLAGNGAQPMYEMWRQRIQMQFSKEAAIV